VFSTIFPLLRAKYICFHIHSRFIAPFSAPVLCFHGYSRIGHPLFEIKSRPGGGHGYLLDGLEFFRVFTQRPPAKAGQAKIFGQGVSAVLKCIELRVLFGGCGARSGGMLRDPARGGEQRGRKSG
jgi:hypothetical protein